MTASERPEFLRIGLRKRNVTTRLRLRWDRSPLTCAVVMPLLPVEEQVYHAKFANNEVYCLVPMVTNPPPPEWRCLYPGPGDLLFLPVSATGAVSFFNAPASGGSGYDGTREVLDFAFFYERGNSMIGPAGANPGTIFATGTSFEELDTFAVACRDVWFAGATGEKLYIEVA